jgi:hypothetical protein
MRSLVDDPQTFLAHMRVHLRGGQVAVAEQLLHDAQIGTPVE